jgi:hypothetical protein
MVRTNLHVEDLLLEEEFEEGERTTKTAILQTL